MKITIELTPAQLRCLNDVLSERETEIEQGDHYLGQTLAGVTHRTRQIVMDAMIEKGIKP